MSSSLAPRSPTPAIPPSSPAILSDNQTFHSAAQYHIQDVDAVHHFVDKHISSAEYERLDPEAVHRYVEKQRRVESLFTYFLDFELGKDTLPDFPFDLADRHLLLTATHMAYVRASEVRNARRLETLLRQSAQVLVERDVDIAILSKPRTSVEPFHPPPTPSIPSSSSKGKRRERPSTPLPKVAQPGPSRVVIDLCTPERSPPPDYQYNPSAEVRLPQHIRQEPAGRTHVKRCSFCHRPGHYRRTCTAARCPHCGALKEGHWRKPCRLFCSRCLPDVVLNDTARVGDITCNYPGPMGRLPSPCSDDEYNNYD
jgi:hypothetical protein